MLVRNKPPSLHSSAALNVKDIYRKYLFPDHLRLSKLSMLKNVPTSKSVLGRFQKCLSPVLHDTVVHLQHHFPGGGVGVVEKGSDFSGKRDRSFLAPRCSFLPMTKRSGDSGSSRQTQHRQINQTLLFSYSQ